MADAHRLVRLLGRGRNEETPVYAISAVAIVVAVIVAVIMAAAFTLWAVLGG